MTQSLRETIAGGESQTVEFKASFTPELGKAICALANTAGGVILLGVDDKGCAVGIGRAVEEKIASVAHACKPSVYPDVRAETFDGKTIMVVRVPPSDGHLHSFGNIAYRRVGNTNRPIAPAELLAVAPHVRSTKFEAEPTEGDIADIDKDAVERFLSMASACGRLELSGALSPEEVLEKLELSRGGHLTNAARLLFGKEPQKGNLQAQVRCARFRGREALVFTDMMVVGGTLIDQIDRTHRFVLNNIRLQGEVKGLKREEVWEYPVTAIREAVTNAVCHRDYTSPGNVHVSIYDDRIEVWNPGGLPPELPLVALKQAHKSIPRNRVIANALYLVKYIERWGTGTQRIVEEAIRAGLLEPDFSIRQGGLEVVLRKQIGREALNSRQRALIAELSPDETVSVAAYVQRHACSRATALRDLREMARRGLLARAGCGRGTVYRRP